MKEIYIDKIPSGRCKCCICEEKIKENQVDVIKGEYKGNLNYARYCYPCALKGFIKLFKDLNVKEFKKLREEIIKEKMIEDLK